MIRGCITLVMIAVAVACPVMCGSNCCATAGTNAPAKKACCSHCLAQQKHDPASCPVHGPKQNSPDQRGGMCCFCGGAVVDLSPQWGTVDLESGVFLVPISEVVVPLVRAIDPRPAALFVDHLQPDSGRSVRILIASLVI